MAVTVQVLVPPLQLAVAATTQYGVPAGTRAIIDKATVTNTDTVNRSFSVNLVTSGGTPGNDNLLIDDRVVVPGETYLCPELVGQAMSPGSFISTTASAATALTFRVTGREVT
jgi:hypothetical protein